ncbi:MAG: tRNA guanosine(34) transglycosylase Tgt [Candidatus Marinimicrobia bacterium]|nr:tRNA guanosine(34) transglycosylase Tgt [Candidatus Neomarinimicrobiota bacterium]
MDSHDLLTIEVEDAHSAARQGHIKLSRGTVATPFFMPIGTYGAVKTLAPWEVRELGAQMILSNTYHLYLRPGMDLMAQFGGVHKFMGWDGPLLTDSGGFQIFSLASLRKLDDDGVTFRSHLNGSLHRFTPEKAIDMQRVLGSDFVMALDECPPGDSSAAVWQAALERTTSWARRCLERFDATEPRYGHPQSLFCIVQGGTDPKLRRQSAEELLALGSGVSGYAIGGLAVGEPKEALFATLEQMNALLPSDKPRYLMGVGTPADLVRAVALGMDMFDCVLPTRNARNGQLFTPTGTLNIRNARYRTDLEPVQAGCDCPLCLRFSRAYLRHLIMIREVLGLRLATAHNLRFYLRLMADMRAAIQAGQFMEWSKDFLGQYEGEQA